MIKLLPKNKHVVIQIIQDDDKVGGGLLFAPSNSVKQYKLAKVIEYDPSIEMSDLRNGAIILYDSLGEISHRVENNTYTTVKAVNIIAIVERDFTVPITA